MFKNILNDTKNTKNLLAITLKNIKILILKKKFTMENKHRIAFRFKI